MKQINVRAGRVVNTETSNVTPRKEKGRRT